MTCQFVRDGDGDGVTCSVCGRTIKTRQPPERVHAACRVQRMRGLGDVLAALLRQIGIEKVIKATLKDCGCKQRQEALNRAVPFSARKS